MTEKGGRQIRAVECEYRPDDRKEAIRAEFWMTGSATEDDLVVIFGDSRTRCVIGKAKEIGKYPLGVLSQSGATFDQSVGLALGQVCLTTAPNRQFGSKAVMFNVGINNLLKMSDHDFTSALNYDDTVHSERQWKEQLLVNWLHPFEEFRDQYEGLVVVVSVVGCTAAASRKSDNGHRSQMGTWASTRFNKFVDILNAELSGMCHRYNWNFIDIGPHERWTAHMTDGVHIQYQQSGVPDTPKPPALLYAYMLINALRYYCKKSHM